MEAEARHIKSSAEYQSQIQEAIQRRASLETVDESDYKDERSDHSEPPWMKEYPSEEDPPEQDVHPSTQPNSIEATA